jgi:membrane protease YdiL (CAAX protease family)
MFKARFSEFGVLSSLLFLLGICLFFVSVAISVWQLFSGGDVTNINSMKGLQFAQAVGMFIIPSFLFAYLWSPKPFEYLSIEKKTSLKSAAIVILFMLLSIPCINLLGDLNQKLVLPHFFSDIEVWMKAAEAQAAKVTSDLLGVTTFGGLMVNLLLIAFVPALGEELFFRGALQRIFSDWKGAYVAIWVTAFVFSTIHFQFYGFLPRFLLGAFFGYLVIWSGSLWLPILAHFTNNAVTILFFYFKFNKYPVADMEHIGTGSTYWVGVLSLVVAVAMLIYMRKNLKMPFN